MLPIYLQTIFLPLSIIAVPEIPAQETERNSYVPCNVTNIDIDASFTAYAAMPIVRGPNGFSGLLWSCNMEKRYRILPQDETLC